MTNLDTYEQGILESVENGEWISKENIDKRLLELQFHIKNQKKKAISKSHTNFNVPIRSK